MLGQGGELRDLREKVRALSAHEAELEARLDGERKSATEKLDLLLNAKENLSDSFKALSADALNQNNQAFLDLAKLALGQAQDAARGELEKRQQAISELITPVRASLEKVDEGIRKMSRLAWAPIPSCGSRCMGCVLSGNRESPGRHPDPDQRGLPPPGHV